MGANDSETGVSFKLQTLYQCVDITLLIPADCSIRLIDHCNPYRCQSITNLICRCKVPVLPGYLTLLDQVSDLSLIHIDSRCLRITVSHDLKSQYLGQIHQGLPLLPEQIGTGLGLAFVNETVALPLQTFG